MTKRESRLYTFAGMIGFANSMQDWDDIIVTKQLQAKLKKFEELTLDILEAYKITETELEKMAKNIRTVRVGTFEVQEYEQKRRNKQVQLTQSTLDTIAEHALNYSCVDCNRNISACALRKALRKANVEVNDSDKKCEYMQS